MVRLLLSVCLLLVSQISLSQTAVDASPTDCNGITHNVFNELDAGKILVIGWTMPCAGCAAPLLDVHNVVLQYAVSDPGVVEYWLADDFADLDCASLIGWCQSNGINYATYFSDAELDQFDYGSLGMPKVVVIGCYDHKVYYNKDDVPNGAQVNYAIQQALDDLDAACTSGLGELTSQMELKCYPNPATDQVTLSWINNNLVSSTVRIMDITGSLIREIEVNEIVSNNEVAIDVNDLEDGIYLLMVKDEYSSETIKVQISN